MLSKKQPFSLVLLLTSFLALSPSSCTSRIDAPIEEKAASLVEGLVAAGQQVDLLILSGNLQGARIRIPADSLPASSIVRVYENAAFPANGDELTVSPGIRVETYDPEGRSLYAAVPVDIQLPIAIPDLQDQGSQLVVKASFPVLECQALPAFRLLDYDTITLVPHASLDGTLNYPAVLADTRVLGSLITAAAPFRANATRQAHIAIRTTPYVGISAYLFPNLDATAAASFNVEAIPGFTIPGPIFDAGSQIQMSISASGNFRLQEEAETESLVSLQMQYLACASSSVPTDTNPDDNTSPDNDDGGDDGVGEDNDEDDGTAPSGDTSAPYFSAPTTIQDAVRSNFFTSTVVYSWTSATDDVTSDANLLYRVVRGYHPDDIDTAAEAVACAAPRCIVVADWATGLSRTLTSLPNGAVIYLAVVVKDEAGNAAVHASNPTREYNTPGFAADISAAGEYIVAAKNIGASSVRVQESDGSSTWSQLGADISASGSDHVSLAIDQANDLWVTAQISNGCTGVFSHTEESQAYKLVAGAWTAQGGLLKGNQDLCAGHSGAHIPQLVSFSAGTMAAVFRGYHSGNWRAVSQTFSGAAWSASCDMGFEVSSASGPLNVRRIDNSTAFMVVDTLYDSRTRFFTLRDDNSSCVEDNTFPNLKDTNEVVNLTTDFRKGQRLAVLGGDPVVAIIDRSNGQVPKVLKKTGGTWGYLGGAVVNDRGQNISLEVLGTDVFILFKAAKQGGDASLARWDGTSWTMIDETVFDGEVLNPLMRVNGATIEVLGVKHSDLTKAVKVVITP